MTRSILSLPPALQELWSRVYTHHSYPLLVNGAGERLVPEPLETTSARAEMHAWESVRRANGGVMPEAQGPTLGEETERADRLEDEISDAIDLLPDDIAKIAKSETLGAALHELLKRGK